MPKNSLNNLGLKLQWWQSTCRASTSIKINDVSQYGKIFVNNKASPIDQYFHHSEVLIRYGNQQLLDANPEIANLLFVGIISHTENYLRELFARLLHICPTSQHKSAGRDIKLGSAMWHQGGGIERGAFEAFSFASSENIIDTIRKYFDISIDSKSDSFALLNEFDQLCELRHAIVHSGNTMSGKNAIKLKLPRTNNALRVELSFNTFQEVSSVCTSLVCSLNAELFRIFANRWKDDWPKRVHGWNGSAKSRAFTSLWSLFSSQTDKERSTVPVVLSKEQCRAEILKP